MKRILRMDSKNNFTGNLTDRFQEEFYIREEGTTDENFGKYPLQRPMEECILYGIVCIDKPMGPTSHEVTVWVRRILEVKKTGHAGTLDPRVTGVLPVLIGNAVKLLKILQTSEKEYITLMRLHDDVSEEKVRDVLKMFTGKIYQRPPLKSAVKKVIRIREIYKLDVLEIDGRDVLFRVRTEAGTYIRKLCYDVGEILGCGAHMQELRRTGTGVFDEESCYTLHDLKDAYVFWKEDGEEKYLRKIIQPQEIALKNVPKIFIKDTAIDAICHGADLAAKGVYYVEKKIRKGDNVALFSLKNEVVAIGRALLNAEDILRIRSGVVCETSRVIMERGTYPSTWKS